MYLYYFIHHHFWLCFDVRKFVYFVFHRPHTAWGKGSVLQVWDSCHWFFFCFRPYYGWDPRLLDATWPWNLFWTTGSCLLFLYTQGVYSNGAATVTSFVFFPLLCFLVWRRQSFFFVSCLLFNEVGGGLSLQTPCVSPPQIFLNKTS